MSNKTESFFRSKRYRGLILATLTTVAIGTVTFHFVEGWRWLDSAYFSVITLTTVGYGDFSPQTDIGKLFTIGYVLTGIGLVFAFIDAYNDHRTRARKARRLSKETQLE